MYRETNGQAGEVDGAEEEHKPCAVWTLILRKGKVTHNNNNNRHAQQQ